MATKIPVFTDPVNNSNPQYPFPAQGCYPLATFTSNGPRTLTLTATDAYGGKDQASRTINVPDAPLDSPPIVTILNPHNNVSLDDHIPVQIQGSAIDPDGVGPVSYEWRVQEGASPTTIGTQAVFLWTPSTPVPFDCGGTDVDLCLYGTDPNGTNSMCIDIHLAYPTC